MPVIKNAAELGEYLVSELESICDADPQVLSDYVTALLRHDKPVEELRKTCLLQLRDFLHDETASFVDRLFQHLQQNDATTTASEPKPAGPAAASQTDKPIAPAAVIASEAKETGGRGNKNDSMSDEEDDDANFKRRRRDYSEDLDPEHHRGEEHAPHAGRLRSKVEGSFGRGRDSGRDRFGARPPFPPMGGYHQRRMAPLAPFPPLPHHHPSMGVPIATPYGLFPPLPAQLSPIMPSGKRPIFHDSDARQVAGDAPAMMPQGRGGRGSRDYSGRPRAFQARSETRLIVDKIPPEHFSIAKINEYFRKFGTLVNITVQPEVQRAKLQYSTPEEAQRAHSSPNPIFDNRFVKVYWDREDSERDDAELRRVPSAGDTFGGPSRGSAALETAAHPKVAHATAVASLKRQEALKSVLELQKQKQELLTKYIAQQKELMSKLENKNLAPADKQEIVKSLAATEELISSVRLAAQKPAPPPSPREEGRAAADGAGSSPDGEGDKRAAESGPRRTDSASPELSAEARSGGTTGSAAQAKPPILRGGPGGRGRGRGSSLAAGPARSFKLDLRPTSMTMCPIPAKLGRDLETLRKFFEPYGQVKSLSLLENGSAATVTYLRRHDAEQAMYYVPKSDLGEKFDFSWIDSSTSSGGGGSHSPSLQQPPASISTVAQASEFGRDDGPDSTTMMQVQLEASTGGGSAADKD